VFVAIAVATIAASALTSCTGHEDQVRTRAATTTVDSTTPTSTAIATPVTGGIRKPVTALFVGDSLLWESQVDVARLARTAGWLPVIDGRPGSAIDGGVTISAWPPRIDALARFTNPDVAVVELGTNPCSNCPSLAAAIDADLAPLRQVSHVYWVNIKDYSKIPPDPNAVNDAITAATKRWPNLHVIDLNDAFRGHSAWLASDDIHFTDAGNAAFASLIVDALPRSS
jgi:lysophospholipase L1-like esterase